MTFHPLGVSAELILGATEDAFDCELRSAVLTPNADWLNTLCPPGTWPDVTWTLDLGYLPGTTDVDGATTLDDYLWQHYGEQTEFVVWPYGPAQPGYSGTLAIAPGPIGGTQGEWPELSTSLPIWGQPDLVRVSEDAAGTQAAVTLLRAGARRTQVQQRTRKMARTRRPLWARDNQFRAR